MVAARLVELGELGAGVRPDVDGALLLQFKWAFLKNYSKSHYGNYSVDIVDN